MELINLAILIFLIVCSVGVYLTEDLVNVIILFSAYSLFMAVLWLILRAPDVALTEAAIGAGVTTFLFVAVLGKVQGGKKYEK